MSHAFVRSPKHAAVVLGILVAICIAHASETPDAAINPVSGAIELTDAVIDGGQSQIRYVHQPSGGQTPSAVLLFESEANDLGPRIDIKADGDTWLVWWRDSATPEVLCRFKDFATGSWSAETRISGQGETGRHPEIAHDGSTTWIVYEASTTSGVQLKITRTDDGPEPIPPATIIATTTFGGGPDVLVHAESGRVWVTWIDSSTQVAWSRYNAQTGAWSSPQWRSTVAGSVASARVLIRLTVLGE